MFKAVKAVDAPVAIPNLTSTESQKMDLNGKSLVYRLAYEVMNGNHYMLNTPWTEDHFFSVLRDVMFNIIRCTQYTTIIGAATEELKNITVQEAARALAEVITDMTIAEAPKVVIPDLSRYVR